jgi:hypothetical protein
MLQRRKPASGPFSARDCCGRAAATLHEAEQAPLYKSHAKPSQMADARCSDTPAL